MSDSVCPNCGAPGGVPCPMCGFKTKTLMAEPEPPDPDPGPPMAGYTREAICKLADEWMVREFGHPSDFVSDPDQRDAWYRDNGLLHHFIRDHFPA